MAIRAVKVTRKGQITLPAELRKKFEIEEGDVVYITEGEHGLEIRTPGDWVARTAGMFRDYVGKRPLEWDRDQVWTEIARERFEITSVNDFPEASEPSDELNDHD
jgi:AbrB family looped-hinge helix DNA binding protein